MAMHCAWCNSALLQAAVNNYQCLACGQQTAADGTRAQNVTYPDVHPQFLVVDSTEPPNQHPDRRVRPGDTLTEENKLTFNPVPDPEPQDVPEPAEPEVTQGPADAAQTPAEAPVAPVEPEVVPEAPAPAEAPVAGV